MERRVKKMIRRLEHLTYKDKELGLVSLEKVPGKPNCSLMNRRANFFHSPTVTRGAGMVLNLKKGNSY